MSQTLEKPKVSTMTNIRLVLIDDHAMVRDSLSTRLDQESDLEVVAVASDAETGAHRVQESKPDVLLMDIDMPGLSCFDAARQIRSSLPATSIVFLSAFANDSYIEQALKVEARGYLTKRESAEVIVEAIRTVAAGGVHFSPEVRSRIVVDRKKVRLGEDARSARGTGLTIRELEVLRYIARGLTKRDMAATMHLSIKTVENHSNKIMAKLNIHNRVDLTRYAIREGLAEA